jgi:tetratricopeptide (TPR) repeat protein
VERPERRDTLFSIGRCLEETGRLGEALDAYGRHVQNQPADPEAYRRMALIALRLRQPENAIAPAEKAVKLRPKDPEILLLSGKVWRALGARERAEERFRLVGIRAGEGDREALLGASKALMGLKDYEGALGGYEKALTFDPADPRFLHGRNAARAMLGIPLDEERILAPGKGIGRARLGATREELVRAYGEPNEEGALQVGERTYSVLNWHRSGDGLNLRVLLDEEGRTVQVETASDAYKTADGIGTANFLRPKCGDRLNLWRDPENPGSFRGTLKAGGLSLYVDKLGLPRGELRAAVVHKGARAADDPTEDRWVRIVPTPTPSPTPAPEDE